MLVTRLIPHSDSSISKMQNIHSKVDSTWQILNTKSEANPNSILMMRRSGSTWSYTVLQYTVKLPCQVTLVAHFECTLTPWQQTARHEQNTLFPPGVLPCASFDKSYLRILKLLHFFASPWPSSCHASPILTPRAKHLRFSKAAKKAQLSMDTVDSDALLDSAWGQTEAA